MADNTNEFRFKSSTRNAMAAVITQTVMGVISFVERMVFNQYFISDYLGFYSLFTNIISILSVAELGLSVAISYALYAPFANDDFEEITALLSYYKKIYRTVGSIILAGGLIFIPFLQYLVKTDVPIESVTIFFIMFLLNTVFEYFFSYKTILFSANQRNYVTTLIINVCRTITYALQILVSIFTQNFYLYTLSLLILTIIRCVVINLIANKEYSFIKHKPNKISKENKKVIFKNVKGLIATRIGNVISDSTNSLLISAMVGSSVLGLYSNYQMITSGLLGFNRTIPNAITASLGNIGATESSEHVADSFKYIDMCYYILYGIMSVVLLNIINPVISIFFGAERCLPFSSALLICILFYIRNTKDLFNTYKSSLGLYWYDRYRPLITGISDLILSIVLGRFMGFNGIILGTIIAYTVIDLWVEPLIIFHKGFHTSSRKTIATIMLRLVFIVCLMILTHYISNLIPATGILALILKFLASLLMISIVFYVIYHKNKYVTESIKAIRKYIFHKENSNG